MSIGIIIQARMESERLPGKMYKKILNKHLLEWVILRTKKSKLAEKIIVAIPDTKESSVLIPLLKKHKIDFYQGSLDNVLDRYIKAAEKFKIDFIIRITGDCPLIDPELIDNSIKRYKEFNNKPDYFYIEGCPRGLGDIEIIRLEALKKSISITKRSHHLEHVVSFILENPKLFKIKIEKVLPEIFRPDLRVCVDEPADLVLIKKIFDHFKPREDMTTRETIDYLDENPKLISINKNVRQRI
jgi:spore coat polysaccharide biosynthesis protein SpsF (cytidylyltransferase family)